MAGDGVSDAPGIRKANAGTAVAGATDAIERSREIFRRMESYAVYRIAETVRILIFLTLCITLLILPDFCSHGRCPCNTLGDIPVMMIAFDNAPVAKKLFRRQMNRICTK